MNVLFTLLFMVLLILKLTGMVAWSWWIIFIPMYIPIFILSALLVGVTVTVIQYFVRKNNGN